MTWEDVVSEAIEYFQENDSEFEDTIRDLDGYNGILGDDRYEPMEFINELYANDPIEALTRAYFGGDDNGSSSFNPLREYFYFDGYGNLRSIDYEDYSDHLDEDFIQDLYDHRDDVDLPRAINKLFKQFDADEEDEDEEEEE